MPHMTPGYGGATPRGAGCIELHACILPPVVVGPTVVCTACAQSKEEEEEEEVSSSWPGFRPLHHPVWSNAELCAAQHGCAVSVLVWQAPILYVNSAMYVCTLQSNAPVGLPRKTPSGLPSLLTQVRAAL